MIEVVEEGVVDDAEDWALLVNEADRDAGEWESVHKVCRSICRSAGSVRYGMMRGFSVGLNVPMGSTQKVGVSVKGGRVPEEYDSSPMLRYILVY